MDWLRKWRQQSGKQSAKLVFVVHSMGGLVARHFLEVLGGWRETRALFTIGTPHFGSLKCARLFVQWLQQRYRSIKRGFL
jgi:triacylglycerol esterase/lipase EstA (alpha/beta hydrolase family)